MQNLNPKKLKPRGGISATELLTTEFTKNTERNNVETWLFCDSCVLCGLDCLAL